MLFSPIELKGKNIRKLETLLQNTLPLNVNYQQKFIQDFAELENEFKKSDSCIKKTEILVKQGDLLFELKRYDQSDEKYIESISYISNSYGAIKGRVKIALSLNYLDEESDSTVIEMISLDPKNPTIVLDLFDIFRFTNRLKDFPATINRIISLYTNNDEVLGNLNYHLGYYMMYLGKKNEAKTYYKLAKMLLKKCLPKTHEAFEAIETSLLLLKRI